MDNLFSPAREAHPRPDFVRDHWHSLCGQWHFAFDDEDRGLKEGWQGKGESFPLRIEVPFSYQSKLSGIGTADYHPILWYHRAFDVPEAMRGRRLLLRFGAVDYSCQVYVNGQMVGGHKGGYTPFHFDISPYLKESGNSLSLRVEDTRDTAQPRGKQYWEDGLMGCWYTPCSGIWQSVYLEAVGERAIEAIYVTSDIDHSLAHVALELDQVPQEELMLDYELSFQGRPVRRGSMALHHKRGRFSVDTRDGNEVDSQRLWSPAHPNLYDLVLTLRSGEKKLDRVATYFGLRKVAIKEGEVLLNNQPIYQRLVLDQGYWPDSNLTPPDGDAIRKDVEFIKAFGFNGVRKHQKIEDPRFYYWCDRLGLLCWGELPSAYAYGPSMLQELNDTMQAFIRRDFNHPSIICWVPLNESWGVREIYANKQQQAASQMFYYLCKAYDPSRLVSGNDGWEQTISDISALHDYAADGAILAQHFADRYEVENIAADRRMAYAEGFTSLEDSAFMVTEYGGIAMTIKGVQGQMENMQTWGYHDKVESEEAFLARYRSVTDAIRELPYCRGYCYTQLTDVMQEVNGLLTPDRQPKIDPATIAAININPEGKH